jgi:hypothetical protein
MESGERARAGCRGRVCETENDEEKGCGRGRAAAVWVESRCACVCGRVCVMVVVRGRMSDMVCKEVAVEREVMGVTCSCVWEKNSAMWSWCVCACVSESVGTMVHERRRSSSYGVGDGGRGGTDGGKGDGNSVY